MSNEISGKLVYSVKSVAHLASVHLKSLQIELRLVWTFCFCPMKSPRLLISVTYYFLPNLLSLPAVLTYCSYPLSLPTMSYLLSLPTVPTYCPYPLCPTYCPYLLPLPIMSPRTIAAYCPGQLSHRIICTYYCIFCYGVRINCLI
jgi:hypothetical protein